MVVVSVEGNIGAGKSAVLNVLEKRGYTVCKENLNSWGDILDKFYRDRRRWSFALQVAVMNDLSEQYSSIKNVKNDIVFIERSPASSNIFALLAKSEGNMTDVEYRIYYDLYKALKWTPHKSFMIDTPASVCLERIKTRKRECEKDVKLEYLEKLDKRFSMLDLEKVDGTKTTEEVADQIIANC